MAASVLNSPRAIQMSVFVVRAFLRLRELLVGQAELASKLAELERRFLFRSEQLDTPIGWLSGGGTCRRSSYVARRLTGEPIGLDEYQPFEWRRSNSTSSRS